MKRRLKAPLKAFALARLAPAAAGVASSIETSAEAARRLALGLLDAEAAARAQIDTTALEQTPAYAARTAAGDDGHDPVALPLHDPVGIHPVVRQVVENAGFTRSRGVGETPFNPLFRTRP